jgi:cytidyltransferase-like protein
VIVATSDLGELPGPVSMADGGFDPLHPGHVRYLRESAELGLPVLCNVSPDTWVARKHVPLLSQQERGELVDAIRWVDYTHLSSIPTVEVLRLLRPRYYVKGSDWRGRLPEQEVATCAQLGIEVVYLETVVNSSTEILARFREQVEAETQPAGR